MPQIKINKENIIENNRWTLTLLKFFFISNLVNINSKTHPRITTKEIERAKERSPNSFLKIKKIKIIIIGIDKINLLSNISSAKNIFLSAKIIDLRFPENKWQSNIVKLDITPTSAANS